MITFGVIMVSISGCSSEDEFTGYGPAAGEYRDAAAKLTLPGGAKGFPGLAKPEEETSYQQGFGLTQAQFYWRCAWEREWLDTQGSDGKRAKVALFELQKAHSMEFMSKKHLDDLGRSNFDAYMEQAKLGDPSGFQQHFKANCKEMDRL